MQNNSITTTKNSNTKTRGDLPRVSDAHAEAEKFAALCADSDSYRKESYEAWTAFGVLFRRAVEGRIWTPERVMALYPVLKEIVDEIEEVDREWAALERRSAAASRGWETRRARRK